MTIEQALRLLERDPHLEGPAFACLRADRERAQELLNAWAGVGTLEQAQIALILCRRLGLPPGEGLYSEHAEIVSQALLDLAEFPFESWRQNLQDALVTQAASNQLEEMAEMLRRRDGWRSLWFLMRALLAQGDGEERQVLARVLLAQLEEDCGPNLGALVLQVSGDDTEVLIDYLRPLGPSGRRWLDRLRERLADSNLEALTPFGKLIASPLGLDPQVEPRLSGYLPLYPEQLRVARERMARGKPGHLLVVGPSGVGKSCFLRQLFLELAADTGHVTLETSTGLVVAGMKYIGEWQGNLRKLVAAARRPARVVLYFGDLVNLTSAGVSEGNSESFGAFLKPWMEEGDILVVGEATPDQMHHLRAHPDILNLFLEIALDPPPAARVGEVVDVLMPSLEADFERTITLESHVLERLIELSELYGRGSAFPGRAVDLLRRVLRDQATGGSGPLQLEPDHLIEALAASTGLPRWLLDDTSALDLASTRAFFQERIIGQSEAVRTLVDLITLVKAGLTDPRRPLAVLFFVGPTGVGKTETARALAEFAFGSPDRMLRFDMSEFKDYDAYQRLIGVPYGGADMRDGLLTRKVREHPFSVLLLDEFEKAHPNVYDLMLQVFDDGRLTSARGEVVSFRQTIVIMTSNLGAAAERPGSLGFLNRSQEHAPRDVDRALEAYFRPEFLNRIQVVHFQALDLAAMQKIAQRELDAVLQRSGIRRRRLRLDIDGSFLSLLLRQGFSPRYGARPLKRALEQLLLLPLARKLVGGQSQEALVRVSCQNDQVRVKLVEEREVRLRAPRDARVPPQGAAVTDAIRTALAESAERLRALPEEKERLLERSTQEGFWDSREEARRVLQRIRHLETLLAGQAELEEQFERLQARRNNSDALAELERRSDFWLRRLRFEPDDQRGAFLAIRALDSEAPAGTVETMLSLYAGRLRLEVTRLAEGWLWVSGPCAYGLLKGEHGLHRFVRKSAGDPQRLSRLVRVDVTCEAPEEFQLSDVQCELRRRKGGSWGRALHVPSVTVVEATTSLDPDETRQALLEYLRARLWREPSEGELVRVYYLEPEREVRDLASGRRSHQLEAILQGELDRFQA